MIREAPILMKSDDDEKLEQGFRRVKMLVAGYRGFPKNAEISLYHTEAEKVVERGHGVDVTPAPSQPNKEKELEQPPADKAMKKPPRTK